MRIKDPTIRKLRNRGLTPLRYQTNGGFYHGWIEKRGRKKLRFYCIAMRRAITLPLAEERYMKEITA